MKSSRTLVTFVLAVAVMACATVAFAQDPPERHAGGPGGPGGFRGRGPGMGMGLPPEIANSLTADQKAQVESIHKGARTKIEDLDKQALTQAQYRAQLMEIHKGTQGQIENVLTPDQKAKLAAVREQHGGRGPGGPGGPGGRRPAPPSQSNN